YFMKINHEGIKITQTVQLSALFLLLQPDDPAEWIFFPAVLDVRQVIEQIKRHFTDLVVVDDVINAVDVQLADRCDDCRCPCTEDFRDSAAMNIFHKIIDVDLFLFYSIAFVLGEFDDGLPRDAGQDGAVQLWSDQFSVSHEEDVHAADFLDIFLIDTVQPEHLLIAELICLLLCKQAGCIVAAHFGKADATADGADEIVLHIDACRVELCGTVIATDRGKDDVELIRFRWPYTEERLIGENERPDIEGLSFAVRHPVTLQFEQFVQRI